MEKPSGILKQCRSSIVNCSKAESAMEIENSHKVLISPAAGMELEPAHSHSMVDENAVDEHTSSDEFARKRKQKMKEENARVRESFRMRFDPDL